MESENQSTSFVSVFPRTIQIIGEFLNMAQEARMKLGDGEHEEEDARRWKAALDGLYLELISEMNEKEFERHTSLKQLTDKYRYVYPNEADSEQFAEHWYDDLMQWHIELMRLIKKKGLNLPSNGQEENKQDINDLLK